MSSNLHKCQHVTWRLAVNHQTCVTAFLCLCSHAISGWTSNMSREQTLNSVKLGRKFAPERLKHTYSNEPTEVFWVASLFQKWENILERAALYEYYFLVLWSDCQCHLLLYCSEVFKRHLLQPDCRVLGIMCPSMTTCFCALPAISSFTLIPYTRFVSLCLLPFSHDKNSSWTSGRSCLWCIGYCCWKWTRSEEFKSWLVLFAFHLPLEKVWLQLFSSPVGWGCRIHRLHLCRWVRLSQRVFYRWPSQLGL